MRRLLRLLTVTLIIWSYAIEGNDVGQDIIMVNEDKCVTNSTIREFMDKYHNNLRRRVALGQEYQGKKFQEREMYGLIYDCKLEWIARKRTTQWKIDPYWEDGFGSVDFDGYYEGNLLDALQVALDAQVKNRKSLHQMTKPRSVLFGCFVFYGRFSPSSNREFLGSCVYHTVPKQRRKGNKKKSSKTKGKPCCEGPHCDEIRKCTIFENSKCFSHLCYVMIDGVHVRNLEYSASDE
ncbi:hypothetical protein Aduo_003145 [Ancylostoma duodenale]